MELSGTKVGKLALLNEVVLKDDLSSYANDFLSKTNGGTISNYVEISGNLNVGEYNSLIGSHQCAIGSNNVVGSKSILIVGIDKSNLQLSCEYTGSFEEIKAIENKAFAIYSQGSCANDSIVTSVESAGDENIYRITISRWYPILDRAVENKYHLTIPDMPFFGDVIASSIDHSIAIGRDCIALGLGANASGYHSQAIGKYAHAEGRYTYASWGAHAECDQNYAERPGCHAEGRCNRAEGYAAHAEGHSVSAIGDFTHASGIKSLAKDANSFVWNGPYFNNPSWNETIPETSISTYSSHGIGTFNINPLSGIDGVFINEKPITKQFAQIDSNGSIYTKQLPVVGDAPEHFDANMLEYIENTDQNFFIDTHIPISDLNNIQTEIIFRFSSNSQKICGIFGYRIDVSKSNNYGIQSNSSTNLFITPGDPDNRLQINIQQTAYPDITAIKFKAVMSKQKRELWDADENALIGSNNISVETTFDSGNTCYLFNFNGNSMSNLAFIGKIYGIKMIDFTTDEIVHEFVPYLDASSNEIGFYDLQAKYWLYKQQPTETFTAGRLLYDPYQVEIFTLKQQIKDLSAMIDSMRNS